MVDDTRGPCYTSTPCGLPTVAQVIMKTDLIQAGQHAQSQAVAVLEAGGLVAFPTDTVYGLAALPWDVAAVAGLYEAKRRPRDRPIPLLLSDSERLDRVAALPPRLDRLTQRFWPGGLTLVLPRKEAVPDIVSAGPTVAVRVPGLGLARDLIEAAGGVLAATSANLSGQPSPTTAQEVEAQLGGRITLIIDGGPCQGGIASSILDCTVSPPLLLRPGAVSEAELRDAIGPIDIPHPGRSPAKG
jgi:L-threonylcarbamoyladenylate synthase